MKASKTLDSAIEMARNSVYDNARYLGKWKGFDVYEPVFEDDEDHFIGLPEFILAKNGSIRWTTGIDEAFAIMDKFSAGTETDAVSTEGTESFL